MNKSFQALVWAENVARYTNRPVIILTPLSLTDHPLQTVMKSGFVYDESSAINFTDKSAQKGRP